jgi:hypothetical protein
MAALVGGFGADKDVFPTRRCAGHILQAYGQGQRQEQPGAFDSG